MIKRISKKEKLDNILKRLMSFQKFENRFKNYDFIFIIIALLNIFINIAINILVSPSLGILPSIIILLLVNESNWKSVTFLTFLFYTSIMLVWFLV